MKYESKIFKFDEQKLSKAKHCDSFVIQNLLVSVQHILLNNLDSRYPTQTKIKMIDLKYNGMKLRILNRKLNSQ